MRAAKGAEVGHPPGKEHTRVRVRVRVIGSDDESPGPNHGRKGAETPRQGASGHTASGGTPMGSRSDAPALLVPQTGADFSAEAKRRKLEKKRKLNPPETQPKANREVHPPLKKSVL